MTLNFSLGQNKYAKSIVKISLRIYNVIKTQEKSL